MNKDLLAYLATPYSKYPKGLQAAYHGACRIAGKLMLAGIKVYSPIVYCHPVAVAGGLDPLDHKFWLEFDRPMMRAARTLIVAHMDGWEESVGIAHETEYFRRARRPIFDLDPKTLRMERRQIEKKWRPDSAWSKPRSHGTHLTPDEIDFVTRGYWNRVPAIDIARELKCSERIVHTRYAALREQSPP